MKTNNPSNRKYTLSICIPTFNRAEYLNDLLTCIFKQKRNIRNFENIIEVIISDNHSRDNTKLIVDRFSRKFNNIKYFYNSSNIGMRRNLVKVAEYATGDYIWFFSDDDLMKSRAIKEVVSLIQKSHPDLIQLNLDLWNKNMTEPVKTNVFNISKDTKLYDRKGYFNFLKSKFMFTIDWLTTYYSSTIVKRSVYEDNKQVQKKFNSEICLFPFLYPILLADRDSSIYITSNTYVFCRADNLSWADNKSISFRRYWFKVLFNHYNNLITVNLKYIPLLFKVNIITKFTLSYISMITHEIYFKIFKKPFIFVL